VGQRNGWGEGSIPLEGGRRSGGRALAELRAGVRRIAEGPGVRRLMQALELKGGHGRLALGPGFRRLGLGRLALGPGFRRLGLGRLALGPGFGRDLGRGLERTGSIPGEVVDGVALRVLRLGVGLRLSLLHARLLGALLADVPEEGVRALFGLLAVRRGHAMIWFD
jgi:hypothetical protein